MLTVLSAWRLFAAVACVAIVGCSPTSEQLAEQAQKKVTEVERALKSGRVEEAHALLHEAKQLGTESHLQARADGVYDPTSDCQGRLWWDMAAASADLTSIRWRAHLLSLATSARLDQIEEGLKAFQSEVQGVVSPVELCLPKVKRLEYAESVARIEALRADVVRVYETRTGRSLMSDLHGLALERLALQRGSVWDSMDMTEKSKATSGREDLRACVNAALSGNRAVDAVPNILQDTLTLCRSKLGG